MEPGRLYRPRVSRETRRLLTAGALAVTALWLLARIGYQERPVTSNPIPAVLGQLAGGPTYDDLAVRIAQLQTRLEPSLSVFDAASAVAGLHRPSRGTVALRLREDLAVTLLPPGPLPDSWNDARVLARDPASGLAVVRLPTPASGVALVAWTPSRLRQQPRYFIASDLLRQGVSLHPVFVGSLDPMNSPLWPETLWAVPGHSDLTPGSFVFTSNAELVGLVVSDGADLAVMPGEAIVAAADRLLQKPGGPAGTIGIEVQPLTESLASVTGASAGVVVTWVEPEGPAMGRLMVGDAIEAVDGRTLETPQHWDVRVARLVTGETLTLRVHRRGEVRDVAMAASAAASSAVNSSLGLTLRGLTGLGAEVIRVEQASAADRAGLVVGDVITLFGDVAAPTPAQVARSFSSVGQDQRVIVAVTRGAAHHVMTLGR